MTEAADTIAAVDDVPLTTAVATTEALRTWRAHAFPGDVFIYFSSGTTSLMRARLTDADLDALATAVWNQYYLTGRGILVQRQNGGNIEYLVVASDLKPPLQPLW